MAKTDPAEGLELMWRFLELANPIFERCDDSSGTVISVFHTACGDLGDIAESAKSHPKHLADRAFQSLLNNACSQYDNLIAALTPAFGNDGLEHLKQRMVALLGEPIKKPKEKERQVVGSGSSGPIYADALAEHSRVSTVRWALKEIADAGRRRCLHRSI